MKVVDIMQTNVIVVRPDATVRDGIMLLEDWHIRHLPVVEDGQLRGMISDRDLRDYRLPLLDEINKPDYADEMLRRSIREVMADSAVSVDEQEDVREAIDTMLNFGVGAVPVLSGDRGRLVGIVSYVDILRIVRDSL